MGSSPKLCKIARCKQCSDLMREYEETAQLYAEVGKRLTNIILEKELDLYKHAKGDFQILHDECERLRKALLTHFASHDREMLRLSPEAQ